jgi:hypothetical protein
MLDTFTVQAAPSGVGDTLKERNKGIVDRVALYAPFVPGRKDNLWRATIRALHVAG